MIDMSGALLIQQRKKERMREEFKEKAKRFLYNVVAFFLIGGICLFISALDSIMEVIL